jgi:hypothetical protein
MKIKVKAEVELEVQLKDVLSFLQEESINTNDLDKVIQEALRKKKGFYTMSDQMKFELFEHYKERYTPEELEKRLL